MTWTSPRFKKNRRALRRRGSVLVLAVLLMIFMFGVLAFAVDIGYILTAETQAQRAADSAALAAALELATEDRVNGDILSIYSDARDRAVEYAALNRVGGEGADLQRNDANLEVGDIVLGRLDDTLNRAERMSFGDWQNYNAVTVNVRRTEGSNGGQLPLFFSRVLGVTATNVTATATAAFADGISGFRASENTGNTNLLPFVVHIDSWTELMDGAGQDNFSYYEESSTVTPGPDGVLEINMFPSGGGKGKGGGNDSQITPGNFGTVDIGSSNNSTADLVRQIEQGVSAADLEHHGGTLELDGQTGSLDLNGDTGISAGMQSALEGVIGDGRVIMLYDTVIGQGNTTMYTIVGFVGVRILEAELHGGDKHITIQPALVVDNTSISSSTSGTSYFIHQSPRLVR